MTMHHFPRLRRGGMQVATSRRADTSARADFTANFHRFGEKLVTPAREFAALVRGRLVFVSNHSVYGAAD